jgi:hypothetical protein
MTGKQVTEEVLRRQAAAKRAKKRIEKKHGIKITIDNFKTLPSIVKKDIASLEKRHDVKVKIDDFPTIPCITAAMTVGGCYYTQGLENEKYR